MGAWEWITFVFLIVLAIVIFFVGIWILNDSSIDNVWGWIMIVGGFLFGIIVIVVFILYIHRQHRKEREEELKRETTYTEN